MANNFEHQGRYWDIEKGKTMKIYCNKEIIVWNASCVQWIYENLASKA